MVKQVILLLTSVFLFAGSETLKAQSYNFNIENLDESGRPKHWLLGFNQDMMTSYPAKVDSTVKHSGRYALKLSSAKNNSEFGSCSIAIPAAFTGKQIVLKAFLKTENVLKGYAGLWMRLDGQDQNLGFDNMNNRGITGTNDWKQFSIQLPFSEEVQTINVGVLLVGQGVVWVDDLSVQIDEKDVISIPARPKKVFAAASDTAFNNGSRLTIQLNAQRQEALTALGRVWGFLKYHHPAIAEGRYNWDAELMRVLPLLLAARNKNEWMDSLENWLGKLPAIPPCTGCKDVNNADNIKLLPDYGDLFKQGYLSTSLAGKLKYIRANSNNSTNYYVALINGIGNPEIKHENAYAKMVYPDAGFRLLALFRYWNIIQYFFPYRHLIGQDWNKVLPAFIPVFINARDSSEYVLACLKLIATVHDTHANIWGVNKTLEAYRGNYHTPFSTTFVEGKLVIRNFYTDTAGIKQLVSKGDVITHIQGKAVEECIKELLPITPASNYSTQLRDIPRFILRGATGKVSITVIRNNKPETISIPRYESKLLFTTIDYGLDPPDTSYKIIEGDIGYVYAGKYKNEQLPAIRDAFKATKGMVIDLRCYPSAFMPFTFGNYIKASSSPFVNFTVGSIAHPGLFTFDKPLPNGANAANAYKGKVVVLVNEQTQSQAEYTTMAFQSAQNVTVIGSTTAGADGNVSGFYLPGGISTMISGIGVYYPDKVETQRSGVKIDTVMKPTLQAFKEGKDELLVKAIELIKEQ